MRDKIMLIITLTVSWFSFIFGDVKLNFSLGSYETLNNDISFSFNKLDSEEEISLISGDLNQNIQEDIILTPGDFSLVIYNNISNEGKSFSFEFSPDIFEVKIDIDYKIKDSMSVIRVQTEKITKSPESVYLEPASEFRVGKDVSFKLVNNSSSDISGYFWPGLFFGFLNKKENDVYKYYPAATICGNIDCKEKSLSPNSTGIAFVPDIGSGAGGMTYILKEIGQYEFELNYRMQETDTQDVKFGEIEIFIIESLLHQIRYQFEVK